MMWGMETVGNDVRNTADLRKDIWFMLEWHLRYLLLVFVGRQAQ